MQDHFEESLIKNRLYFSRQILLMDDYEGSVNYTKTVSGCTGKAEKSSTYQLYGNSSLLVSPFDAAPAANDSIYANKDVGLPLTQRVRLYTKFMSPDYTKVRDFRFILDVYDGLQRNTYAIWFTIADNRPKSQTTPGITMALTGDDITLQNNIWYDFELIINISNKRYEYLIFGSTEYEFTDDFPQTVGATTNRRIQLRYYLRQIGAAVAEIYFDNTLIQAL